MNQNELQKILEAVHAGELPPAKAVERLKHLPFEDLGFAKVDHHRALRQGFAEVKRANGKMGRAAKLYPNSGVITIERNHDISGKGTIVIVSAGTSDIAIAEEALLTAQMMGNRAEPIYDVGVAGIHRLLEHREKLTQARVIICVAGMEGALPSVVGGLVAIPVIAVPTSVGYGASFGGVAALLGMLNSCASNVTVVNIDNGFGAACVASCIN